MRNRALCESDLSEIDKAVVVLAALPANACKSVSEIAGELEAAGHAKINKSRLQKRLNADKRVVKHGQGYRISPRSSTEVTALAKPFMTDHRPAVLQSKLDPEIFENSRSYVKNVVEQINISYEHSCYDCAAVMIRRLFETLIVDSFENQGALSEILKPDGNIHQLSVLISRLKSTSAFSVSRQTKEAAEHLKDIGDWSAHNRRHRARKSDLDNALRHMRLASSDLLHLAGQE